MLNLLLFNTMIDSPKVYVSITVTTEPILGDNYPKTKDGEGD